MIEELNKYLRAGQVARFMRNVWTVSGFIVFNWLILPVSICLYQRLSHACVSTVWWSNLLSETADGSLNQSWSKWAKVSFWITVENPELIHAFYESWAKALFPFAVTGLLTRDAFIRPRRAHTRFSLTRTSVYVWRPFVCRCVSAKWWTLDNTDERAFPARRLLTSDCPIS